MRFATMEILAALDDDFYSEDEALAVSLEQQASFTPPINDCIGTELCTGSASQYVFDGGHSACTSICLVATEYFLRQESIRSDTTGPVLDAIVQDGVQRHTDHGHASVDDIWKRASFSTIVAGLHRGQCHQACLVQGNSSRVVQSSVCVDELQRARRFAGESRLAALLVRSGETILCLCIDQVWYLFDSHGQSHETDKKVYLKEFDSVNDLGRGLLAKYPVQDFGEDSILSEMFNTFEIHPLVLKGEGTSDIDGTDDDVQDTRDMESPKIPADGNNFPAESTAGMSLNESDIQLSGGGEPLSQDATQPNVRESSGETDEINSDMPGGKLTARLWPRGEPDSNPPEHCRTKPTLLTEKISSTVDAAFKGNMNNGESMVSPCEPFSDPGFLELDDYTDPILFHVMADPVSCEDGCTYDRSTIERCFQERIEAEEARLAGDKDSDSGDTCCGERQKIDIISPLTGEVLGSDALIPNRTLEKQIVRLVERQALDMSQDDIADWHKRREQKRCNDHERAQKRKDREAREAEMRQNAAEATAARAEEIRLNPATARKPIEGEDGKLMPSEQLLLARNIRLENEKLSENDLGLSVALCNTGERIMPNFFTSSNLPVRCMVGCCVQRLESSSWCARCGRLTCQRCLNFGVTDISDPTSTRLHLVCFDCVLQVLELINPIDVPMSQTRAMVQRMHVNRHQVILSNDAAELQDRIVSHEMRQEYHPRLQAILGEMRALRHRRSDIKRQIKEAKDSARQSRLENEQSGVATSDPISNIEMIDSEALMEQIMAMERVLANLKQRGPPKGAKRQMQYAIQISDLSHKINVAEQLAKDQSARNLSGEDEGPSLERPKQGNGCLKQAPDALLNRIERLQAQFNNLQSNGPPEGEEAQLQYAIRLSDVASQLETAQIERCEALSARTTPDASVTDASKNSPEKANQCAKRQKQTPGFVAFSGCNKSFGFGREFKLGAPDQTEADGPKSTDTRTGLTKGPNIRLERLQVKTKPGSSVTNISKSCPAANQCGKRQKQSPVPLDAPGNENARVRDRARIRTSSARAKIKTKSTRARSSNKSIIFDASVETIEESFDMCGLRSSSHGKTLSNAAVAAPLMSTQATTNTTFGRLAAKSKKVPVATPECVSSSACNNLKGLTFQRLAANETGADGNKKIPVDASAGTSEDFFDRWASSSKNLPPKVAFHPGNNPFFLPNAIAPPQAPDAPNPFANATITAKKEAPPLLSGSFGAPGATEPSKSMFGGKSSDTIFAKPATKSASPAKLVDRANSCSAPPKEAHANQGYHRAGLDKLYTKHKPEKLKNEEKLLNKFKGREEAMFERVEGVYKLKDDTEEKPTTDTATVTKSTPNKQEPTTKPTEDEETAKVEQDVHRARLVKIYTTHNPDKLKDVDILLKKYKGRENEMFERIKAVYNIMLDNNQAAPMVSVAGRRNKSTTVSEGNRLPKPQNDKKAVESAEKNVKTYEDAMSDEQLLKSFGSELDDEHRKQLQRRLVAFYKRHNAARVDTVNKTLEKYCGREETLLKKLREKYITGTDGVLPATTRASKSSQTTAPATTPFGFRGGRSSFDGIPFGKPAVPNTTAANPFSFVPATKPIAASPAPSSFTFGQRQACVSTQFFSNSEYSNQHGPTFHTQTADETDADRDKKIPAVASAGTSDNFVERRASYHQKLPAKTPDFVPSPGHNPFFSPTATLSPLATDEADEGGTNKISAQATPRNKRATVVTSARSSKTLFEMSASSSKKSPPKATPGFVGRASSGCKSLFGFGRTFEPEAPDETELDKLLQAERQAVLESIGSYEEDWPLPLGLRYPTKRMEQQIDIIQNSLSLRKVASQRHWEDKLTHGESSLRNKHALLEKEVERLVAEMDSEISNAESERVQLEERRRLRAQEQLRMEDARQKREQERLERERKAREEADALRRRHETDERKTQAAFASAHRRGARQFGGAGDLRMCGLCRAGPFENKACSNLATHNDTYAGGKDKRNANHCPHCDWHDDDWRKWPLWDGVHGPH